MLAALARTSRDTVAALASTFQMVLSADFRSFDQHDIDAMISIANIVAQSARQHQADERQRLILREMAHRGGNLLQVSAFLASQTFRYHADPQVAMASLMSRLDSLSRANHLITRGGWGQLACYLSWRIEKYGGTSSFAMEWRDSQQVQTQARGSGFGSKLKRALVEQKWRGTMSVNSEGPYRFSCCIPLPEPEPSQDETTEDANQLVTEATSIEQEGSRSS